MSKDIARYDRMREMSGEPPLVKELLSSVVGVVGDATIKSGATGLIADLTNDLVRYAKNEGHVSVAIGAESGTRYVVSPPDSWIDVRRPFDPARACMERPRTWTDTSRRSRTADGTVCSEPAPRMHVEFPVEQLRSGNGLQDREMWKMIDSKRFPTRRADLRELRPATDPGRYAATGDVTLAGRSRRYDGDAGARRDSGDRITIDGELEIDIRDFGLKPPSAAARQSRSGRASFGCIS